MKFALTKFEKLALVSHLVGLPSPNPEYGRRRLRAWDELDVADLADRLATAAVVGGAENAVAAADWSDRKKPLLVDLTPDIVEHLISGLGGQTPGVWSDTITRVRERLEQLRDKKYKLPEELRPSK
jgi:hypothetical protein